ncbi:hypothetical protein WJX73_008730 [Symbiochloris irregularis]|uniref:Uncharacterized protein n=1 Tax=Symbiochloris irregularis TaxID=706552 RepID=A0AAW1PMB9_9CHLO
MTGEVEANCGPSLDEAYWRPFALGGRMATSTAQRSSSRRGRTQCTCCDSLVPQPVFTSSRRLDRPATSTAAYASRRPRSPQPRTTVPVQVPAGVNRCWDAACARELAFLTASGRSRAALAREAGDLTREQSTRLVDTLNLARRLTPSALPASHYRAALHEGCCDATCCCSGHHSTRGRTRQHLCLPIGPGGATQWVSIDGQGRLSPQRPQRSTHHWHHHQLQPWQQSASTQTLQDAHTQTSPPQSESPTPNNTLQGGPTAAAGGTQQWERSGRTRSMTPAHEMRPGDRYPSPQRSRSTSPTRTPWIPPGSPRYLDKLNDGLVSGPAREASFGKRPNTAPQRVPLDRPFMDNSCAYTGAHTSSPAQASWRRVFICETPPSQLEDPPRPRSPPYTQSSASRTHVPLPHPWTPNNTLEQGGPGQQQSSSIRFDIGSEASLGFSQLSSASLAELERLVEAQHRQLVAKGILPPDEEDSAYPLGRPAPSEQPSTATGALSGASLAVLKQLADKLAEGLSSEALLAEGTKKEARKAGQGRAKRY